MAKFWDTLSLTITASADEEAHAHGLDAIPELVILCGGGDSHVDITVGATAPDATNIYMDNANVGDQSCKVVVGALHSLINGV